jgi:hypothetical protein
MITSNNDNKNNVTQEEWLRVQKGWRVNQEGMIMFPGG